MLPVIDFECVELYWRDSDDDGGEDCRTRLQSFPKVVELGLDLLTEKDIAYDLRHIHTHQILQ